MKKGTRRIALSQGKFATVSSCDFNFISSFKWFATKMKQSYGFQWYARRTLPGKKGGYIYMHREIMNKTAMKGCKQYDHKDRDGLNNARENIRPCTYSRNGANRTKQVGCSSRFKGVNWHKWSNQWRATIMVNGKSIHLGYFRKEIDAHRAYVAAAIHYFGEFAAA